MTRIWDLELLSKVYYSDILTFCKVCAYFWVLFTLIQSWNVTILSLLLLFVIIIQCLWRHWPFYLPSCFKQWESGDGHKMSKCSSMYSSTRLYKHIVTPTLPIHLSMGVVIYLQTISFHWSLLPLTNYLLSLLLCADCLSVIFFNWTFCTLWTVSFFFF